MFRLLGEVACRLGKHAWGDWYGYSPGEKVKTCQRCRVSQHKRCSHDWNDWRYCIGSYGEEQRTCRICGVVEQRRKEYSSSERRRGDCPRCGGSGRVMESFSGYNRGTIGSEEGACPDCQGTGGNASYD